MEKSELLFLLGLCLVTFTLLRRSFRYFGRRPKKNRWGETISPKKRSKKRGHVSEVSALIARMDSIEVELDERARDLMGELDSKMLALQHLTRQATEESCRLQELLAQAQEAGLVDSINRPIGKL